MNFLYRRIFKSQLTGTATLQELLQTLFVAELVQPGEEVWIVSPWISNVVLIDNRSGSFDFLNPEWGRREIRLTDVLITLMNYNSHVHVVTRNDPGNDAFHTRMRDTLQEHDLQDKFSLLINDQLHTKGILLTQCLVMGSMNLTYNGMMINDESIDFSIDLQDLAQARIEFRAYGE
jgi:hypothetical protein